MPRSAPAGPLRSPAAMCALFIYYCQPRGSGVSHGVCPGPHQRDLSGHRPRCARVQRDAWVRFRFLTGRAEVAAEGISYMSKLNRACAVVAITGAVLAFAMPSWGAETSVGGVNGQAARGRSEERRGGE